LRTRRATNCATAPEADNRLSLAGIAPLRSPDLLGGLVRHNDLDHHFTFAAWDQAQLHQVLGAREQPGLSLASTEVVLEIQTVTLTLHGRDVALERGPVGKHVGQQVTVGRAYSRLQSAVGQGEVRREAARELAAAYLDVDVPGS